MIPANKTAHHPRDRFNELKNDIVAVCDHAKIEFARLESEAKTLGDALRYELEQSKLDEIRKMITTH